jgi:hypothetical protein
METSARAFSSNQVPSVERPKPNTSQGIRSVNIIMGFSGNDFITTAQQTNAQTVNANNKEVEARLRE